LFKIFSAYSLYDKGIGYIQGMNFIGGALLVHCDEVVTFWLLTALFESREMREVFDNNLIGSLHKLSYLDSLI